MESETVRYMATEPAARYLGLSPRSLEKMRLTGAGPVFRKFGRRVLYAMEDLEAWAQAQRRRSTSDPGEQHAA
jgi:hypothetical protein